MPRVRLEGIGARPKRVVLTVSVSARTNELVRAHAEARKMSLSAFVDELLLRAMERMKLEVGS